MDSVHSIQCVFVECATILLAKTVGEKPWFRLSSPFIGAQACPQPLVTRFLQSVSTMSQESDPPSLIHVSICNIPLWQLLADFSYCHEVLSVFLVDVLVSCHECLSALNTTTLFSHGIPVTPLCVCMHVYLSVCSGSIFIYCIFQNLG